MTNSPNQQIEDVSATAAPNDSASDKKQNQRASAVLWYKILEDVKEPNMAVIAARIGISRDTLYQVLHGEPVRASTLDRLMTYRPEAKAWFMLVTIASGHRVSALTTAGLAAFKGMPRTSATFMNTRGRAGRTAPKPKGTMTKKESKPVTRAAVAERKAAKTLVITKHIPVEAFREILEVCRDQKLLDRLKRISNYLEEAGMDLGTLLRVLDPS